MRVEATGEGYLMCRVTLVSREHPDLDPGISEVLNAVFHSVLQQVFHGSHPKYVKVFFDILLADKSDIKVRVCRFFLLFSNPGSLRAFFLGLQMVFVDKSI
jgi:hypothetical protein